MITSRHRSSPFPLGRIVVPDPRDSDYPMRSVMPKRRLSSITSRNWTEHWAGDQGDHPYCVGYGCTHWVADGPIVHPGKQPPVDPVKVYREAQKLDEFPGTHYEGTSVRGGFKALQKTFKLIDSYHWAQRLQDMIDWVLDHGPLVIGINWYEGMFTPTKTHLLNLTGDLAGGHCVEVTGCNTKTQRFRVKNSWGLDWGDKGHALIRFADMERLIFGEQGEAGIAVEVGTRELPNRRRKRCGSFCGGVIR